MIEYRIEFSSIGRNGTVYFKIYKYRDGVAVSRIGDSVYTAGDAEAIVKGILAGEKQFVIVPKEARLVFY